MHYASEQTGRQYVRVYGQRRIRWVMTCNVTPKVKPVR